MHRDQKIGLSLGVLLVGFAAAFCFRHEPLDRLHPLALEQTAAIDSRIEQLPVRAYTRREGIGEVPEPLESATDLVDVAFVDQPIRAIALEHDATAGDVVDLFVGPPEPMPAPPRQTVNAAHLASPPAAAGRAAAPLAEHDPPPGPVDVVPPQAALQSQPSSSSSPATAVDMPPYVVTSGDTLSGVSLKVYGTVGRYLEIYQANRDVLRDPDDLPVGTTLQLPPRTAPPTRRQ